MNKKKTVMCIMETLVVNILIYIIFYQIQPNRDVYLELNPHPLFILCIAMGMRYGNYLGLISAAISSLFYLVVFQSVNNDFSLLFLHFKNYKYLLFFFWSAVIFGSFKDNYDASMERTLTEKKILDDEYEELKKDYKLTRKIQDELKKQIIGSEESILHLYEIASRLGTLDQEEVYTETIGILSKYLKADAVSVYTYHENSGYLRLKIRTGIAGMESRSLNVRESAGFREVALNKQVIRWDDVKEEGFPLMSAPLVKDDKVMAVVNIEHMDFDTLSEYAFQLFKLITNWVNKALGQAIYVDGLKESRFISGTGLLRSEAFEERLNAEARRKEEFGLDFATLQFKVSNMNEADIDERIKKVLRTVDVVGFDPDKKHLKILLPATPKDNLPLIEERIIHSFGAQATKIPD
ncbi:GAF domain-containing protein [Phosphitispora sp. TUW77]|uniref:GAF domain-containing protein n=1 Tax=Phosphitispora sp. TUW77 TaxID=3152361 RepID=UPI003AB91757